MSIRTVYPALLLWGMIMGPVSHAEEHIIHVSTNAELIQAIRGAEPGTQIRIAPGRYQGGLYFDHIQGIQESPIVITGDDPSDPPVIEGEGNCLHLSDVTYLQLRHLILRGATSNGLNIDDGGSYETPSHHILLEHLVVQDIGPKGNRDGIKLSGVDEFEVRDCTLERWGDGGSGIDMVGCHQGKIIGCSFRHGDTVGANSVQMKGGSHEILVRECRFEHGGSRAVNIGGSTGLAYFRPHPHQGYEARNITVERCAFLGSQAPVAFVGVDGAIVRFNAFYYPQRWVLRILQETTGPEFVPCRNGIFADNLIVFREAELYRAVNIGPHTLPESFRFERNHWVCLDAPERSRLELPTPETDGVYSDLSDIEYLPDPSGNLDAWQPGKGARGSKPE